MPAQLLIRSTRSSNVHVELNVYLFEVEQTSHSVFNVRECSTKSQYAQFNMTATHESKQHIKRYEKEFKNSLVDKIILATKMEYYRLADLVIMSDNHVEELIFVEFYILSRDELSTPQSPTISTCLDNLNQTINSEHFVVDMSGLTGQSDRFTAVVNSLGEFNHEIKLIFFQSIRTYSTLIQVFNTTPPLSTRATRLGKQLGLVYWRRLPRLLSVLLVKYFI